MHTSFWKHGPFLIVPCHLLEGLTNGKLATEKDRTFWLKPVAFGGESMRDLTWQISKDGEHWIRWEPQMPRRSRAASMSSVGQGTRNIWSLIQDERQRDEQAGRPWRDNLDSHALIATANFVDEGDLHAVDVVGEL